jgi:methylase of polypeptide subunit release factors
MQTGSEAAALFVSEAGDPPPQRVVAVGDATRADDALRAARAGEHLLYHGDERNARQLLAAMARRIRNEARAGLEHARTQGTPARRFEAMRDARTREHALLAKLLVELDGSYALGLANASDVAAACTAAWGAPDGRPRRAPLRELLGIVGAYEWQQRGIEIPALGARIHPHYGVFAPTRRAYALLVAAALAEFPLAGRRVFDIGTGTGVLALLAAKHGARAVVATDLEPRALRCARENAERLGLGDRMRVEQRDLFPDGRADLVLANPPWLPGAAHTALDRAVYDPQGDFLARWLAGLRDHLEAGGEGWLVISDLPERLGLRPRGSIAEAAARAGLASSLLREVLAEPALRAKRDDPIAAERAAEKIQLFRFGTKSADASTGSSCD